MINVGSKGYKALLLGCSMLIASCAPQLNVDDQLDMVATPASWQSADIVSVDDQLSWLSNDSDMADLTEIVTKALDNNPDLRISANRLRTSLAQQSITDGARSITGDLTLGASRNGDFESGTPDNQNFSLRGGLAWEADIWGRLASNSASAEQSVRATKNDLDYARMSLATRTAQRYFDVIEAVMQVALLEQNLEKLLQAQDLVDRRYDRGIADVLDMLQIQTNVATAKSNLANQQQTVIQRMRTLEVLIGSYPSGKADGDLTLPSLDTLMNTGIPTNLLEKRPDIMAAKNRVLAANYNLESAKKALYPSLRVSGSTSMSGSEISDIADIDELVWSVVGNMVQPILDGTRRRSQVVINEVALDTSLANYLKTVLNAYQETENALTAEMTLAEQERHLTIAVDRAVYSEERALDQYSKGLVDILSLVNVQRNRISSQQSLLRVKYRRLLNRADLHLALGGENLETYINQMTGTNEPVNNQGSL
ncbi:TolC family protein [Pseudemcibacter aquimaris]|uniref:TolC family protein n=1 Tax=Pseudemcibacter aquimaris TaxID=2857064 RepID=UPI0020139BC5|nr:TolC family protein [Pseudemcibacter aquimaris]MCC3862029.1 TolC family protein [Pseudemcibacter aquimaris]WDU58781.1 TolC family protein [Pseudemcibacter aquimaris]